MNRSILKDILLQEDVVTSVENNLDILLEMITEIGDMIGFEHNHPHHHLDVWNHTLLALSRAPKDFEIRLVLLLHDIGKPHSYQDEEIRHFHNHALVSYQLSKDILARLNFSKDEIKEMCYLIKEHDSPISIDDIESNVELAKKRFKVQFCDALAHHPLKLEKRIKYLININEKVNNGKEKEKYRKILNSICNVKK